MHTVELIRDLKIKFSLNIHNLFKKKKDLTLKMAGQTSHRPSNTATPISVSVDEICLRQILSLLRNFVPCERSLYLFTNTTFSKRFRLPWNYQSCAVNNHLKECWLASKFESLSFLIQTKDTWSNFGSEPVTVFDEIAFENPCFFFQWFANQTKLETSNNLFTLHTKNSARKLNCTLRCLSAEGITWTSETTTRFTYLNEIPGP